jgi:FSR family fosmidomycin resistance protein-like MFS transporter
MSPPPSTAAAAPIDASPVKSAAAQTTFWVIGAVSFCHMLNDMMQSLLPAIYPNLQQSFHLNFAQIGLLTLAFQLTASLLQPVVGLVADKRPMPFSLPGGAVFTLTGLLLLGFAQNYVMTVVAACIVGMGSSVFHPECSRVARMAAGPRPGFAQAMFQVGGNVGSALGPLLAAMVVATYGHSSISWCALTALISIAVLGRVGWWYKTVGMARIRSAKAAIAASGLSRDVVVRSVVVLLILIFSKFFYLASISSYYTFYLIHHFGLSVRNAQLHLFLFLASVAVGTMCGGPIGDRYGRKHLIWFSILGALPFTLMLPFASLFWTSVLSVVIGLFLASAFPAIVVYGQELLPGRVGMVSGLFFGFSFGMGGLGAALIGVVADMKGIDFVYHLCAFLPALGLLAVFLPRIEKGGRTIATSPMVDVEDLGRV